MIIWEEYSIDRICTKFLIYELFFLNKNKNKQHSNSVGEK